MSQNAMLNRYRDPVAGILQDVATAYKHSRDLCTPEGHGECTIRRYKANKSLYMLKDTQGRTAIVYDVNDDRTLIFKHHPLFRMSGGLHIQFGNDYKFGVLFQENNFFADKGAMIWS